MPGPEWSRRRCSDSGRARDRRREVHQLRRHRKQEEQDWRTAIYLFGFAYASVELPRTSWARRQGRFTLGKGSRDPSRDRRQRALRHRRRLRQGRPEGRVVGQRHRDGLGVTQRSPHEAYAVLLPAWGTGNQPGGFDLASSPSISKGEGRRHGSAGAALETPTPEAHEPRRPRRSRRPINAGDHAVGRTTYFPGTSAGPRPDRNSSTVGRGHAPGRTATRVRKSTRPFQPKKEDERWPTPRRRTPCRSRRLRQEEGVPFLIFSL